MIELIRKHDWNDTSFEIFYRFGITTVVLVIIAGVLSIIGGPVVFTDGDDNATLTITVDNSIAMAAMCFTISMAGLIAPILYAVFIYGDMPRKKEENQV